MTDQKVTQLSVEVWSSAGAGSAMQVTQVGVETWANNASSAMQVTQVGVEVWSSVNNNPPPAYSGAALLIPI